MERVARNGALQTGIVEDAEPGTIPDQQCTASLRCALHRIRETPKKSYARARTASASLTATRSVASVNGLVMTS
jgi:hypothetical protein